MKRLRIASLLLFTATWYLLKIALVSRFVPWPHEVAAGFAQLLTAGDDRGITLLEHAVASLTRLLSGFFLAAAVAVPLGTLMGHNKTIHSLIDPIVEGLRPVPPIAWIPLIVLVTGSGLLGQSLIVFTGAFFPILLNTIHGIQETPKNLIEAALTLGVKQKDLLKRVLLPYAFPFILTGARIGLGVGWMCIVAAEMMGLKNAKGLGFEVLYMGELGHYWGMVDAMIMIGLAGYAMNKLIRKIEQKYEWKQK